ncbi:MAG: transporter substrate-binding domain-containing protein, partial [Proteobacteria bacterium]|nr:transporter substrate-binding domain-containing protein [Pseudomonadota bacterium]
MNLNIRRNKKLIYFPLVLILSVILGTPLLKAHASDTPKNPLKKDALRTIIVDNYYPYTYVNKDGAPDGFSIDLAKAVTGVMGMELKITINTWERAKSALENGEIDFLPMMAYSAERNKTFDFSVPHTIAYDAIFTRVNTPKIKSINEIAGKKIIVMKNDQAYDYLISATNFAPENLILIDDLPDALRLLSSGKGDAALMPKLVGLIVAQDLNLMNLSKSPAVIEDYTRPFSFAVKKGNQLLSERLSQGLNIVKN